MPVTAQRAFTVLPGLSTFLLNAVFAASLAGASASAGAQTTLPVSPALACLTSVEAAQPGQVGMPVYPQEELGRREGGTLRVKLQFNAPDQAPTARIVSRPDLGDFDNAVLSHVKRLRVPCMQPGDAAVNLTQDYVFDPNLQSRVIANRPRDDADPDRAAQLKCMAHKDRVARPDYPLEALERNEWGSVVVKMRFVDAAKPPVVEMVQPSTSRSLNRTVLDHVAGIRIPCLGPAPVESLMAYKYMIVDGERMLLKDNRLQVVLGGARDLKTPAKFDFGKMGCPFELRITYHQPFAPNNVEQLDANVPERAAFMDWLRGLTFKLSGPQSANVFGDKFVVGIPCAVLDL